MTADGTAWLRARLARESTKRTSLGGGDLVWAHEQRELREDLQNQALHDQVGERHEMYSESMFAKGNRRGVARRAAHSAGSGSVPWYVPAGAEWDLEMPNSTAELRFDGEQTWWSHELQEGELDRYHRLADQLYVEEREDDVDTAPPRWPCRNPTSEFDLPFLDLRLQLRSGEASD